MKLYKVKTKSWHNPLKIFGGYKIDVLVNWPKFQSFIIDGYLFIWFNGVLSSCNKKMIKDYKKWTRKYRIYFRNFSHFFRKEWYTYKDPRINHNPIWGKTICYDFGAITIRVNKEK